MRITFRKSWHEKLHDWLSTYDERGLPAEGTINLTFCEIQGMFNIARENERKRLAQELFGRNWRYHLGKLIK